LRLMAHRQSLKILTRILFFWWCIRNRNSCLRLGTSPQTQSQIRILPRVFSSKLSNPRPRRTPRVPSKCDFPHIQP
jgi:hypothetical protein